MRDQMKAAGAWVFSGGLNAPSTATVLRLDGGDVLMTDGPFAEGKEYLGGFTIIKAPDLDAALEWGRRLARVITAADRGAAVRGRGRGLTPGVPAVGAAGDRACVPRGVRPRGGRPGPPLR